MNSFDEIYILNLHGNSLKKEKCPDGSKDENVFDIQQGVAIALFIKNKDHIEKDCNIYYAEKYGSREVKYEWLLNNDIKKTDYTKLHPTSPYYFFIPRDEKSRKDYEKYQKITDIFPVNVTGIVTARDHFVIDFDKSALKARIMTFMNKDLSDNIVKNGLKLKENYMWRISKARKELTAIPNWENYFTKILYRPFDIRDIYFHDSVVWRTRKNVMQHMMQENLGLILSKRYSVGEYNYAFAGNNIIEGHVLSGQLGITYLFPLYLYPNVDKKGLFSHSEKAEKKKSNIIPKLLTTLFEVYRKEPTPEIIFYYIYAVLYSNTYRSKYAEFLKIDFPRIPFTKDYKLFQTISEYGNKLVDLHLLKSSELDQPIARFQGKGDNSVEKIKYDSKTGHLYINETQYFEGITPEVFEYQIGGYQVCDKWLKDRKGRALSLEEIQTYCRIVTAIENTIKIQDKIDAVYQQAEKDTV